MYASFFDELIREQSFELRWAFKSHIKTVENSCLNSYGRLVSFTQLRSLCPNLCVDDDTKYTIQQHIQRMWVYMTVNGIKTGTPMKQPFSVAFDASTCLDKREVDDIGLLAPYYLGAGHMNSFTNLRAEIDKPVYWEDGGTCWTTANERGLFTYRNLRGLTASDACGIYGLARER
jgi:hypothetical protein